MFTFVFFLVSCYSVSSSNRVTNPSCKTFIENMTIFQHYPAFRVNIKLCERNHLAQLKLSFICVINWDRICLISTSPDNQVSIFNLLLLIFRCLSFYELYSFLFSFYNICVKLFCISSKTCKGINITFLIVFIFGFSFIFRVVALFCFLLVLVEDFYRIFVKNFD